MGRTKTPAVTRREKQILEALAEGLSNDEIAEKLVISEKTVKYHLTQIYLKKGYHSRARLIVAYYKSLLGKKDELISRLKFETEVPYLPIGSKPIVEPEE